ncbi:hydrolase [Vibrio azureus]|uniref:Peptidase C40 family protein n=1 Tax=Vibrio azureus NBRC 104587 TaxID=1219077 RepID=U3AMW8_9VIBR|nr:NlpC/P60 family protein [Vibrio azureus]AUI86097.1 hydrolase [Vibrio azureus]GAD74642.1 peptidase C40 family protein [Vibrio azureus NBRC 104587]
MNKIRLAFIPLFISILLSACSSNHNVSSNSDKHAANSVNQKQTIKNSELMKFYEEWQGTPYRLGGTQKSGIDCSAFVQKALITAYQFPLPRTTRQQVKLGKEVSWEETQQGDLVFFKTRRSTYHVGVYLGDKQFMHASTSKGVIISRMDNPYWASKFWQVRRVML